MAVVVGNHSDRFKATNVLVWPVVVVDWELINGFLR